MEACGFLSEFAQASAPALWKETVKGQCDLARGRCKFPAVLSTTATAADAGRSQGRQSQTLVERRSLAGGNARSF